MAQNWSRVSKQQHNRIIATACYQAITAHHSNYCFAKNKIYVAWSGGRDSTALLMALSYYKYTSNPSLELHAVHIQHGLAAQAQQWQSHCEHMAAKYGVVLSCIPVKVCSEGKGIEAAAREARFSAFADLLTARDCILLGHHQADQAETVLLRLMRASGLIGLSAMNVITTIDQTEIHRPMLGLEPADLEEFCLLLELQWVEDQSNQEVRFDRNFIRHQVMPVLATRWQKYQQTIATSAQRLADSQVLLDEYLQEELSRIQADYHGVTYLPAADFRALGMEKCMHLLRCWLSQLQLAMPAYKRLNTFVRQVGTAHKHKRPRLSMCSHTFIFDTIGVFILPNEWLEAMPSDDIISFGSDQQLQIQFLTIKKHRSPAVEPIGGDMSVVTTRYLQQHGLVTKKTLKRFWQSNKIPVWMRSHWPFILQSGQIKEINIVKLAKLGWQ